MTGVPHRGFADAELQEVADRVGAYVLEDVDDPDDEIGTSVWEILTSQQFATLLHAVRAALDAVRAESGAAAPRPFPPGWWIARTGLDACVWRATSNPRVPAVVAMQHTTDPALWQVLAAALPDRGDCVACRARPCPTHAAGARG